MSLLSNVFFKICNKSVKPVEYSDNYKFIRQYRTSDFLYISGERLQDHWFSGSLSQWERHCPSAVICLHVKSVYSVFLFSMLIACEADLHLCFRICWFYQIIMMWLKCFAMSFFPTFCLYLVSLFLFFSFSEKKFRIVSIFTDAAYQAVEKQELQDLIAKRQHEQFVKTGNTYIQQVLSATRHHMSRSLITPDFCIIMPKQTTNFANWILVQFPFYSNPKFQASSLCL